MDDLDKLLNCTGFQWDKGNAEKSWLKHGVSNTECEEIFFNQPLLTAEDREHSWAEKRYHALGRTDTGRLLFVSLTIRKDLIRVISARDMSRKERIVYEETQKADTEV
jgi:uncharacterized DUF497 family protein